MSASDRIIPVPPIPPTLPGEKRAPKQGDRDWYGEQNADGVDLSLIRANLVLSVDERLAKGDRARASALAMLEYARQHATQQPRRYLDDSPQARG